MYRYRYRHKRLKKDCKICVKKGGVDAEERKEEAKPQENQERGVL